MVARSSGTLEGQRLSVKAFGPLDVSCKDEARGPGDFGGARPRQIFEILLSSRGHPVPKDRLVELLWEHDLPRDATAVLESHVSVLRRHLSMCGRRGRDVVITVRGGYSLEPATIEVDLDTFDELVIAAANAPKGEAVGLLEEALSIVRGPVFEDEPTGAWATRMRVRYDDAVERVRLDAAEAALALRSFGRALDHAAIVARTKPTNERACRIVMMAAYAAGDQERAVRAYLETRAALADGLGIEPLSETQALYLAILRHESPDSLLPGDVRRTERGFRRLVDQQGAAGWWTVDPDLRVTSVAGVPGRMVGLESGQATGRTLDELFTDAGVAEILSDHRRALGGEPVTREIAREGRTYEVHLEPMRRGPDVVGVVGVSVDVTDRDRTAATLEELEDALSAQYEGFPIPSYTWRLTGDDLVLVDYNEAGERASAGQVREYLGKRARSVYRDEPEILRDLLRTAAERTTFRREMRYKVPGADERDLSVTYVFAQPDRVVVHIQDLTDRREMEEELAQFQRGLHEIVDGASDAMFILDPWADLIIAANEAAAELLGYRREELLSRHPSDLHREEIGPFLGFMNRVDVSGSGWTDELSCTMKDGRLLRVEIAATRISFHRRRAVVAVIRPIEPGREADPALLEMLSGARER